MNNLLYPIYIISKGRYNTALTAKCFQKDNVDFHLVVEPQEYDEYSKRFGEDKVYKLPFSNLGMGGTPARNWCWQHAKNNGHKRHWIFDDNIQAFGRLHKGKRLNCNSSIGIKAIEEFTDRYENIAISGFNYRFFVTRQTKKPYTLNCHVYSALLINNDIPFKWRLRYNEDTDLCLQVLTTNYWCTVLFNAFYCDKMGTMKMKGGNTTELYKGDGRLKMARSLEAVWPQWVTVKQRFGRPQHVIKNSWRDFTHPLIRRKDIDWNAIAEKKWDIKLKAIKEVKSASLRDYMRDINNG
jgi:hypothetical protein